jgi:hypothetical protein
LATGRAVFLGIKDVLARTMERLRSVEPLNVEYIRNIECKIWKEEKVSSKYILCVDTSEGTDAASAFDAITVWEVYETGTLEQCVTAKARVDSASLAGCIVDLSKKYNDALIAVERANKGFSILDKLMEAQGKELFELYKHEEYDQASGKTKKIPGWRPTQQSKSAAIGRMEEMFRAGEMIIRDVELAEQALSYEYDANSGKARAPEGGFSDILTTAYIAAYCWEDVKIEGSYDTVYY